MSGSIPASNYQFLTNTTEYPSAFMDWNNQNLKMLNGSAGAPTAYSTASLDTDLGLNINPIDNGNSWQDWMNLKGKGGMALGGFKLGVDAFNSWMNMKNQKFLQNYYGEQMDLQKADFANNANSANEQLSARAAQRASNQGLTGTAKDAYTTDFMSKWGAKTSIG